MTRSIYQALYLGALIGLVILASACSQVLGINDVGAGDNPTPADATRGNDGPRMPPGTADAAQRPSDAGSAPVDASPALDFTCSDRTLDSEVGPIELDTAPAGNDFAASCGGADSPELLFSWTAPVTDYYSFNTYGSSFDTVLAIYDQCGGIERACNNNVGQLSQSELILKLTQGEQALLAVDGAAGDSGEGTLQIDRVSCPDADLEGQTFPVELSTLGFGNDQSSDCGGKDHEDRAYHWVAPEDGLYYFRATSETFTPVISLIDGPRCEDRQLACNGAAFRETGAEVVRFVRAGQPLSVVVDGIDGAGLFDLEIGLSTGPVCPESSIADRVTISDEFTERSLAPSCGFARQPGPFGGIEELGDNTYAFTAPGTGRDCIGSCNVRVTAEQEVVLYALEGNDCGGAEVDCIVTKDPEGDGIFFGEIYADPDEQDTDYVIVVSDRTGLDSNRFDLSIECNLACP